MKNIYISLILLFGFLSKAQSLSDALIYSSDDNNGTARYRALNGAMGAIGGDVSAMGLNPAGSAIFAGSEAVFSFGKSWQKNQTNYFGTHSRNNSANLNFSQFGIVSTHFLYDSPWNKFVLGFNYQKTHDFFGKDIHFLSENAKQNLGDFFVYHAQGIAQQDFMLVDYDQNKKISANYSISDLYYRMKNSPKAYHLRNGLLAYHTGLITPFSGKTSINSSMSDTEADAILKEKNYDHRNILSEQTRIEYLYQSRGGIQKYNFNISTQFKKQFFFGINLNSHIVDYKRITHHQEFYKSSEPQIGSKIESALFKNEYRTVGKGFSVQLGGIYKQKNIRLGLAYESPTWFTLQEELNQYLQTTTVFGTTYKADPNQTVIYQPYDFSTSGSFTASFAYVFNKKGFINIDYIYKGYQNNSYDGQEFQGLNQYIKEQIQNISSIRLGVEYRVDNKLNLRAGYRYEASPYRMAEKNDINSYSIGLGYLLGATRFDISYDITHQNSHYHLYESVYVPASVKTTRKYLLFSVSFRLF